MTWWLASRPRPLSRGGELLIGRFGSVEELEVFTAGMAVALSVLPDEVVEVIDQFAGE